MRILVTCHSIAPSSGGLRVGVLGICKGLATRGHQVTLITTDTDGNDALDVPLGVPTEHEGMTIYYYPVQLSILGNKFSMPLARALDLEVQHSDVVLIHSLYQFTSSAAAHYCRRHDVPYVLRPHGSLDPFLVYRRRRRLKWIYMKLVEQRDFDRAAAIQYSCETEEAMTSRFLKPHSPSLVVAEGIDLGEFSRLPSRGTFRAKHPSMSDKTLILFLGRFHQKKGIELLVSAFGRVANRCPNAHLVLAGTGDRDYVAHIARVVSDSGLAPRSTITGPLSDDDRLAALADADLFVLPSHGENFGLAVVEAMACGLPVLISDKVGIWEDVAKSRAGIVTSCDPARIGDAIERLVDDPGLRATLGRNGRLLAETRFSIDQMAQTMEMEYQALCSGA